MAACPKCQKPIDGRPNFCPSCGASITIGSRQDNDALIGRIIANDFKVEALVGEGAMGRVYQAQHLILRAQNQSQLIAQQRTIGGQWKRRIEAIAQAESLQARVEVLSQWIKKKILFDA